MAIDDYGAASEWDADFASLALRFQKSWPAFDSLMPAKVDADKN
jgi:hypothetical protein